jgi:FimV-like protein
MLPSAGEDQDYTFAIGLFSDQLYELSAEQFDSFLQKYPTSVRRSDAIFVRAECAYFLREYEKAIAGYEVFLQDYRNSEFADNAHFRIGQSQLSNERFEDAAATFKTVIDAYPGSPLAGESAYWLGESYDRQGDTQNALKYFTLSFEHFTENPYRDYAMYAVGWTYQKSEKYEEARATYEKLKTSFPESVLLSAAAIRIGECAFGAGEYRAAIDLLTPLRISLDDSTLRGDAIYTIAESHYLLNEYDLAIGFFQELLDESTAHQRSEDALFGLGWCYIKASRFDSAAIAFSRLTSLDGDKSHEAAYRLGYVLREAGEVDSARSVWLSMYDKYPDGAFTDDALVDAADIALRRDDLSGAVEAAQKVVDAYPESNVRGDALWMIGEKYFVDGDPGSARPYFLAAANSTSSSREIRVTSSFRAALSAFKVGAYDTSAAEFGAFRQAYTGHPQVPEATYWLAESEYRRGNFDTAGMWYREAAARTTGKRNADALYGLGWAAYKQQQYAAAVEAFGRLISGAERSAVDYDARMRQADALFAMKEYARAGNAYRSLVRLYPDTSANDVARYQAAQCAFRQDDFSGAYGQFKDVVKIMPASPLADDAQYAMGWINFRRKQYEEAIKDFQNVIRSFIKGDVVPRAYYSLGDSYYNLGEYGPAEQSYRNVITLFPESPYVPDAITGLQYCLVALGKESEAVEVIDEFIAEHPTSSAGQTLLLKKAEILYGKGDVDAAGDAYRSFISAYPGSDLKGQALYWLGRSERTAGRIDQAYEAFTQSWTLPGSYTGLSLLEALDIAIETQRTEAALSLILTYEREALPADIRPDVAYRKAQLFQGEGNTVEGERLYEEVAERYPAHTAGYQASIALSRIALSAGDAERARSLARFVASARTDDIGAEGQYIIGLSYAQQLNWKEAITAYLRVKYIYASSREWNDRSMLSLASAYRASGEPDKAEDTLREFLEGSPDQELRREAESLLQEMGGG